MDNAPNFLQPSSVEDIKKSLSFFKKRYERFYHHTLSDRFLHIVGDGLLVILILFFGSYASFSYLQQRFFAPVSAKLAVILPGDIITVGKQTSFLVRYENKTRVPLRDARILFQFHPFFESATSSDYSLHPQTRVIELGTIEAKAEKEFIISGVPFGALYDEQTVSAELSFQNNTKEGREHIPSFARYRIQKGSVRLACAAPNSVTYYQVFEHGCTLTHESEKSVERLVVEFLFPSSYTKRSFTDVSDFSLAQKEKKELPLLGFFQKEGVGAQRISAHAYLMREEKKYFQDEARMAVRVRAPALFLSIRHDPLIALLPGRTYPFVLHWKNESTEPVSDASVRISVHGDFLDIKNLTSKDGIQKNKENVLTWTKGQISRFKTIAPSEEGDLLFDLTLEKAYKKQGIDIDHAFQVVFEPSASYVDLKQETVKVFSISQVFDISSDISLQAFARYYTADGEQIGRGPLPPRTGKTTRYQIFFAPKNSIHAIENFTVTAQLGSHTTWTGIVPIGSDALRYYPEKRTLTYLLPILPSVFKGADDQSGAVFELVLTPTAEDKGTAPILLQNIRATGKDSVTRAPLEFNVPNVTTDLVFDQRAKNMGISVK